MNFMALEKFNSRKAEEQKQASARSAEPREKAAKDVKGVMIRLTPDQRQRLKRLAVDEETSVQALGLKALSRLFEEKGLDPL